MRAKATGIEGLDALEPSLPLFGGGLFFYLMNKTKKRAAKRTAQASTVKTTVRPRARRGWQWPWPLDPHRKIENLKAYREYHGCTLREAKEAVEAAMINHQMRW